MYYPMYFDPTYILVLIGVVICLIASAKMNSTFSRYSRVRNHSGMTGRDAAEQILHREGLYDVRIEHISGNLTDHYDPRTKTLRLSDATYNSTSVAALGVAAHECGHAVQHAMGYVPLKLRSSLVPVANFGNKEKVEAQIALSYTLGDAYTLDYWVDIAKKIEEMGANSICIKDMAGLLTPYKATELIGAMKEAVDLPIQLHTHYTSGVASMTYMKAVEAGVDVIDTAISPFALGTSQPATEVMVETFKGTPYDTGFDQSLLAEIADYFRPIRDEALDSGLLNPKNLGVNIKTLLYQVPGGMLSNLTSQLKEQGAEDKFYDVLEEVPRVRKDLGEPPLVTPSSQIVGTQAVFNVLMGERYKMATKETKDILSGKYGATVKPFNPDVVKKVLGDNPEVITCRPADLIPDELGTLEKEMEQYKEQDEDVLSYALFPQVATDFFKYREAQEKKVDATIAKDGSYPV